MPGSRSRVCRAGSWLPSLAACDQRAKRLGSSTGSQEHVQRTLASGSQGRERRTHLTVGFRQMTGPRAARTCPSRSNVCLSSFWSQTVRCGGKNVVPFRSRRLLFRTNGQSVLKWRLGKWETEVRRGFLPRCLTKQTTGSQTGVGAAACSWPGPGDPPRWGSGS